MASELSQRRHLGAIVVGLLLLAAAPAHAYRVGVFYIHGKGEAALQDKATARAYWGDFMYWATPWQPYGYSAMNGTYGLSRAGVGQLMVDADNPARTHFIGTATPVVKQIAAYIRAYSITHLIVVTHSMGGNVLRFILSNRNYYAWCAAPYVNYGVWYPADPMCKAIHDDLQLVAARVNRVYPIAAPFLGSEAADLAASASGSWYIGWIARWLSGGDTSTENCRTSRMAYFNANYLYGTADRPWPPGSSTALWRPQVSGIAAVAMGNDGLHSEDYQLMGAAAWLFATKYSDGLVTDTSQKAVGSWDSVRGRFLNNHWHSKFADRMPYCLDARTYPEWANWNGRPAKVYGIYPVMEYCDPWYPGDHANGNDQAYWIRKHTEQLNAALCGWGWQWFCP